MSSKTDRVLSMARDLWLCAQHGFTRDQAARGVADKAVASRFQLETVVDAPRLEDSVASFDVSMPTKTSNPFHA
jgi:hypothetical protein